MINIDLEKCVGCGTCVQDCPLGAIRLKKKKASIDDRCTLCGACVRICPEEALSLGDVSSLEGVECEACPIGCRIKDGNLGACLRYRNESGKLVRVTPLHAFNDVEDVVGPDLAEAVRKPLITGIGAGTTYPDCKPAPHIVQGKRYRVDVVTVVTEAPLSYSGILVKIDTDIPIGEEGSPVLVGKRKVGLVTTEQYGAKMLSIGGVNLLTGRDGFVVARTITDIANKKPVRLKVEGGGRLEIQVGQTPVIEGQKPENMRVGCGSATLGLFAPLLKESADEAIILDSHLTGLMSEHAAGRFVGVKASGVTLKFRKSTPGRYFGDHGKGWGGTSIIHPTDVIAHIDRQVSKAGMTILITETTGQKAAMFVLQEDGVLKEVPLSPAAQKAVEAICSSCEPSLVSALYMGGAGGSARAGVTLYPVKLTQAVHGGKAHLTVGGAPAFILPGGGINFLVDVERVKNGFFYWTPTPATICPVEYTMTRKDYEEMGGHLEAVKPFRPPKVLD
ncbi:MAG: 4Fe-4S binding protein [Deltaproteobacteria bacterium]|nr:4Fe-4S binding protein [Deltaproteobacteria bacterium]